jgi:hypothetical protein
MLTKPALQTHAEHKIKEFQKTRKDDHKHVGASEVGLCLRRVKFAKLFIRPIESWGASQRGKNYEDHFWVPAMRRKYGKNLLYAGEQQRSFVKGNLRATPDGLLINQPRDCLRELGVDDIGRSREIVIDCKSIDPRINLGTAKPEHEFQIQVQMALMRVTTKHKPMYGVVAYTNASFFDDVIEFAFKYDPRVYEQAKKRAALVKRVKLPLDLEPEGWLAGGKECEYCPFSAPCRELRGDIPPAPPVRSNLEQGLLEELMKLAREERRLHALCGATEGEHRKIQHEIKELLRAHGLNRISHDGITIVWSPVKGRPAFDMPALKSAAEKIGLDVQQFETVGDPTDRLTVTIRELKASPQTNQNRIIATA